MNIEESLEFIIDAFKRIKKYASLINGADDLNYKEIIILICDYEISATEHDLRGREFKKGVEK